MPSKKTHKKTRKRISSKQKKVSSNKLFRKKPDQKKRISIETVMKVARIARLNLSDAEAKKLSKDLNDVLHAFRELDKANVKSVQPSFQPLLVKDVFREDVVEGSVSNETALKNTKHKEKGFFKGPRAV